MEEYPVQDFKLAQTAVHFCWFLTIKIKPAPI